MEFAPKGSKFFLLREDPSPEETWCQGMEKEPHKSCLPYYKLWNIYRVYPVTLSPYHTDPKI